VSGARAPALRRARIVQAMVQLACERGFAGASVAAVCARARVSGNAFYEAFDTREACFLEALDEGHRRASLAVERVFADSGSWLDGVRMSLVELLSLFDDEPQLARVCIVESLAAGSWALERRQQHIVSLMHSIVGRWGDLAPREPHAFANEGVTAAVLGVIQHHLLAGRPEPLRGLLGPLMGLVAAPYMDPQSVAQEVERAGAIARHLLAEVSRRRSAQPQRNGEDVPEALRRPRAHRARASVRYLANHPGASNREIARAVGIARDTQISTMLARLVKAGLLEKRTAKPGGANSWTLTRCGQAAVQALETDRGRPDARVLYPTPRVLSAKIGSRSIIHKEPV
jgi:AcrR family transcriptional regulator